MGIFNSYVSLPEGICRENWDMPILIRSKSCSRHIFFNSTTSTEAAGNPTATEAAGEISLLNSEDSPARFQEVQVSSVQNHSKSKKKHCWFIGIPPLDSYNPLYILGNVNPGLINPRLRLLNWEGTIRKYQIMTKLGEYSPNFSKPWFSLIRGWH